MKTFLFTDEQTKLLKKIGVPTALNDEMSDETILEFEDKVTDYLSEYGVTNDEENAVGALCADILTQLVDWGF